MDKSSDANFKSPDYLWGQLLATRAMLLCLAGMTSAREEFREESLAALERLRSAALPNPVPDATLSGIDDAEEWLRTATAPDR